MRGLVLALRSDLWLWSRARTILALVAVPATVAVARIVLGQAGQAVDRAREAALGGTAHAAPSVGAWAVLLDGVGAAWSAAWLLLVAWAAVGLASEREQGVIRSLLTTGVSRSGLVVARFLSLGALGLLICGVSSMAAAGSAAIVSDFGPVVEDGVEIFSASEVASETRRALGAALVTLPATLALGLVAALVARSPAQAVGLALGSTLGFDVFKSLLGDASRWVYAAYQPSLVDTTYLREVARMARGFSDFEDLVGWNWIVPLPEAVALLAVALWIVSWRRM